MNDEDAEDMMREVARERIAPQPTPEPHARCKHCRLWIWQDAGGWWVHKESGLPHCSFARGTTALPEAEPEAAPQGVGKLSPEPGLGSEKSLSLGNIAAGGTSDVKPSPRLTAVNPKGVEGVGQTAREPSDAANNGRISGESTHALATSEAKIKGAAMWLRARHVERFNHKNRCEICRGAAVPSYITPEMMDEFAAAQTLTLRAELQIAANLLFLLDDEVKRLGCRAVEAAAKVKAAAKLGAQ